MKNRLLGLLMMIALLPLGAWAQTFVNLTPRPKTMITGTGYLNLPNKFSINCNGADADCMLEAQQFANAYAAVTGAQVSVSTDDADALIQLSMLDDKSRLKPEGYTLKVTTTGVEIKSKSALGFYYAFQSLKKILPANVMAGVKDAKVTTYPLPVVSITDEPRFDYRGFMLDVSRHFFTVNEVKRMIELMSYYKLNKFHWHLTDDQGWRIEIKKYPKLTTIGATASNSRFTDMYERTQYWINKPYGPYFYTQEEIKDVVAYATERHIDIIPEIDMPGHFCAAMAAYPEFSCTPNGTHIVQIDGNIYNDILNVADPKAVQFAKDVLGELIDIFPGEYINIGGDECPTTAWENNALCKAQYKQLGLTSYRQLQSHFIKEMNEYVTSKGRKLAVWNEAITAAGADLDIMKATDATIYCWTDADAAVAQASKLGMQSIYTPWGPYYINRRQGNSEMDPPGAGDGSDNVQKTYNQNIPSGTTRGVQGTFWCEHVSDREYMEWLALPRLLAVAERGWSTETNKNFSDFQKRMTADTTLLQYGDYKYCNYLMLSSSQESADTKVYPFVNTAEKKYYYRIISGGTDNDRKDRCIELLAEGSSLITQYTDKGAAAGVLWTNAQAAEGTSNYDYQWWSLEQDPANPGKYALVCKAQPNGSVKANPSNTSTRGRWSYDNSAKHYNFVLGTGAYGKKGNNYYYSMASDQVSGQFLNSSMPGQGLAVNVYNQPTSGAGGQWEFSPLENYGGSSEAPVTFDYLKEGKTYTLTNAVKGFEDISLIDNNKGTSLKASTDAYANNAWTVEAAQTNTDGSQTLKLRNAITGRYITSVGSYQDLQGCPVSVGSSQATANVTLSYVKKYDDLRVKISDKSLFPLPSGYVNAGTTIKGASYDAARGQGSEWRAVEVNVFTFKCKDDQGNDLGTFKRSIPASVSELTSDMLPTFKNLSLKEKEATGEHAYNLTYKREAFTITYHCTTPEGAIIADDEVAVPVGENYTVAIPTHDFFTFKSADKNNGTTLTPTADLTINATYTTDAYIGVKKEGKVVTQLEGGKQYLLYDATTATGRSGYRAISGININRELSADNASPYAVWELQGSNNKFKVYNPYSSYYVPLLVLSTATKGNANGGTFTFTLNTDGETFNVKGTNGQYWDGNESGDLVGWNQGKGHPIRVSTFFARPMYKVNITYIDEMSEKALGEKLLLLDAGSAFTLTTPTYDGYTLSKITGNESFDGTVKENLFIRVFYAPSASGISSATTSEESTPQAIYDLQGRRLQGITQRGIYIIGGKKVLVK